MREEFVGFWSGSRIGERVTCCKGGGGYVPPAEPGPPPPATTTVADNVAKNYRERRMTKARGFQSTILGSSPAAPSSNKTLLGV